MPQQLQRRRDEKLLQPSSQTQHHVRLSPLLLTRTPPLTPAIRTNTPSAAARTCCCGGAHTRSATLSRRAFANHLNLGVSFLTVLPRASTTRGGGPSNSPTQPDPRAAEAPLLPPPPAALSAASGTARPGVLDGVVAASLPRRECCLGRLGVPVAAVEGLLLLLEAAVVREVVVVVDTALPGGGGEAALADLFPSTVLVTEDKTSFAWRA